MKSKTDFESDKDYYDYLKICFSGMVMQGMIAHYGTGMDLKSIARNSSIYADELVDQLKSKKHSPKKF